MKKQLLEDFGDSQSSVSSPPARRHAPGAAPASAQPTGQAAAPSATQSARAGARTRAGVWRSRAPSPVPEPRPRFAAAPQAPPAPPTPPVEPAPTRPEPSLGEPVIAPELASFSSRQPDWTGPLEADTMPWTERWGRKALGWSLALAGIVAVAGTAAWMVRETKVESTLAIVADHSAAPATPPTMAPPAAQAAPDEPPPLKLLPPEAGAAPAGTVAAAPQPEATAVETPATQAPAETAPVLAPAPVPVQAATPAPVKKKPAAKRPPERRLAATADRRGKTVPKNAAKPKGASERGLARALADAQRSRQESLARPTAPQVESAPQPAAAGSLADTLRLCRAAGYHATACIKRGCQATRFGLVCRG